MPMARGWYVKGKKLAFPNGVRLVSGPFDDHGPAFAEARRIRPFYPDATLDVVLHTGKTLPERTPRSAPPGAEPEAPMFDLRNATGRRDAAAALAMHAELFGARVVLEDWDGEPDLSVSVPALNCNIWLAWTPAAPMPIISWRATRPGRDLLEVLSGAWRSGGTLKATSKPETWPALFDALEIGICGGLDGTAFDWESA